MANFYTIRLVRFKSKIFFAALKKTLCRRLRCSYKFWSRRIGSWLQKKLVWAGSTVALTPDNFFGASFVKTRIWKHVIVFLPFLAATFRGCNRWRFFDPQNDPFFDAFGGTPKSSAALTTWSAFVVTVRNYNALRFMLWMCACPQISTCRIVFLWWIK
jgi:hypothetical protein